MVVKHNHLQASSQKKLSLKQLLISKLKPQPVGCEEDELPNPEERLASFSSAFRAVLALASPADTKKKLKGKMGLGVTRFFFALKYIDPTSKFFFNPPPL